MPIAIANVELSNSFDNWRNTTNDIIKALKEEVVLQEQLDLNSLSPFPELVGAASLDSVEVSAQPSPTAVDVGGYPTGNSVVISPTTKITNFKPGQKVRIYGAKLSSTNPGTLLPPNLTAVNRIGFVGETTGSTFSYKIAQFDYTTGRISGCTTDSNVLTANTINPTNFNDVNYIGVSFTRADPNYGVLIYRSASSPVNSPYSLVAVLGPKNLVDGDVWNDYFDYNYVPWSKKNLFNAFTTNSGLIHFPLTPSLNARLGWAAAEVSFVDPTLYRVQFVNDYNFENNMVVSHDDTSIIQTAINNRRDAGGKSLELATKTYIVQGLTIPDNFAIIGNATKTVLRKLSWSSHTSPTGNRLLKSETTNTDDFSITNVVIDGNMQNQYLLSETGDEKANYLIDIEGSTSRYENIKLINAIGGGISAANSNSISIISSFLVDSNLDDYYYYSPLDITSSSDVLITSNIFRNFSGGIEASVVTSGSIVGNIIKNCGSGLVIYGSTNLISSPNILMGTAGEFLPTPDILNSEYDSVNIKLEPNNDFESTVYVYQENGSNFNLVANRAELFHRIDKLQKDPETGAESLYGDEILISGNRPLQTASGNDLANGQFSFDITQQNVDILLTTYSYNSLKTSNPNHVGLVYRSMLKEYVPTGNVNPVFTPLANNISKTISANTLGVNSVANTIKVTNNDAVNTYFNFNVGDMVYYNLASTSTAIGGLTANTVYYVSFANNTDVALSTTYNGANIDLTEIRTAAESHNLNKTVYVVKLFDGATHISFGKKVRFLDHGGTPDLNGLVGTVVDFNPSSDICAIAYNPTINISSPGTVGQITVENSFVLAKGRFL